MQQATQFDYSATVLLVDEQPAVRLPMRAFLQESGLAVLESSNGVEALQKFAQYKPNIVIVDLKLPDMNGLAVLAEVARQNADVPVVMLSDNADMNTAIEALKLGASDFLTKPIIDYGSFSNSLARCLQRVKKTHDNRRYREYLESEVHAKTTSLITQLSERRKVDKALRHSELRFKSVIENATDIICTLSFDSRIVSLNSAFTKLTGFLSREWLGQTLISLLHADDRFVVQQQLNRAFSGKNSSEQECRIRLASEGYRVGELIASLLTEQQEVVGVLVIIRDITERKQAEQEKQQLQMELLQAQKLESIGRLAGGVAHDFNNALTAILGFSDLALAELPVQHPIREYVGVIKDAGEKAAALTKQLLAFGRKQILKVEQVCLNSIVLKMGRMLQRLIGDDVLLHLQTGAENSLVLADPAQLEQIIMNLVINARDAMPDGGELWISTYNESLSAEMLKQEKVQAGEFVVLLVRDSGAGMSEEARARIFEPFYTTKEPGKGTGLGLATVFGILSQHRGFIHCDSALQQGTSFRSYLPTVKQGSIEHSAVEKKQRMQTLQGGHETILVVDDEPAIRRLLVRVLKKLGYNLLQAGSGEEALEISHQQPIDLLLTDMVMPGINGKTLADRLLAENPELETVFMSGYAQQTVNGEMSTELEERFIQKPLQPFAVAQKIRQLLD